ncbi:MAG: DUF2318 domain-containing protein [Deltaproteobacteria bacterium]|nr:DUF2318 domain-containing protein [Deltaproteobacteria bacterium]MBF0526139.1 DUF2318 domain-containing protein [Deltaproteobacteria bacterium]
MSSKVSKSAVDPTMDKKTAVLGTGKKNRVPLIIFLACAVAFIGAGLLYSFNKTEQPVNQATTGSGPKFEAMPVAQPEVGPAGAPASAQVADAAAPKVSYPAAMFNDGKAKFFEYKTPDGLVIKYFVIKSSDGVIRAAFDACDVCWPAGKGYYQEGNDMVCRNCGRHFPSTKVNDVTGGCNPSALHRQVVGSDVVITINDILSGKKYFDFSKRG